PPNVEYLGHVPTARHNELNAAARLVLNVHRESMVRNGWSPATRMFEALACGIPLVCAPWRDAEGLFRLGDYVVAETPAEMEAALVRLARDEDAARRQAERGRETILARHTCEHRARELLDIVDALGAAGGDRTHALEAR
ncbi:MAG TPA: glycosyltransferase, partial [Longimicrobium sp.]|nr:glycosyltransferase [Longimicrobium sp.]